MRIFNLSFYSLAPSLSLVLLYKEVPYYGGPAGGVASWVGGSGAP